MLGGMSIVPRGSGCQAALPRDSDTCWAGLVAGSPGSALEAWDLAFSLKVK